MQGCKYLRVSPIHTRRDEAHLPHTHAHTHTHVYERRILGRAVSVYRVTLTTMLMSLGDKRNLLFFLYDRRILGHEFADSICRDSG